MVDAKDKLYTYTIITTDSNKQLGFLHDRMPVILDNGSEDVFTWLDSSRSDWTAELQGLLKPFQGDLECYPVTQDVGKVGNDSPTFIVPIDSVENKQNIANFFGSQGKASSAKKQDNIFPRPEVDGKIEDERDTVDGQDAENNAPKPVPKGTKRGNAEASVSNPPAKALKRTNSPGTSPKKLASLSSKRSKHATINTAVSKTSPSKGDGSKKITSFFGK